MLTVLQREGRGQRRAAGGGAGLGAINVPDDEWGFRTISEVKKMKTEIGQRQGVNRSSV